MADIVERLRDMHCDVPESYVGKLRIEASDEIEMLWNAVAEKNAEIERLRAALSAIAEYTPGKDAAAMLLRGYARNALSAVPALAQHGLKA